MENKTPEEILDEYLPHSTYLANGDFKKNIWLHDDEFCIRCKVDEQVEKAMQEYGKQQYNQGVLDCIENAEVKQIELPKTYDPRPCFKYVVDKDSMKKLLKQ